MQWFLNRGTHFVGLQSAMNPASARPTEVTAIGDPHNATEQGQSQLALQGEDDYQIPSQRTNSAIHQTTNRSPKMRAAKQFRCNAWSFHCTSLSSVVTFPTFDRTSHQLSEVRSGSSLTFCLDQSINLRFIVHDLETQILTEANYL
jgi:hypothetical protein